MTPRHKLCYAQDAIDLLIARERERERKKEREKLERERERDREREAFPLEN
jgi:hypothetical protein